MPCAGCTAQFSVFKRKKQCHECRSYFCNHCLRIKRDRSLCAKCLMLTGRPLNRSHLLQLRSKDLVQYLKSLHVSTSGCVEKEDLVNLLMTHVNSEQFHDNVHNSPLHRNQQMGQSTSANPIDEGNGSSTGNLFRQFNLQNLWASVQEKYDNVRCRPNPETTEQQPRRVYTRVRPPYHQTHNSSAGERQRTESEPRRSDSRRANLLETQDCVEIEDIGDWEFLSRTGEPLSSSDPAIIVEITPPHESTPPIRRTTSEIEVQMNTSTNIDTNSTARRHSIHTLGTPEETAIPFPEVFFTNANTNFNIPEPRSTAQAATEIPFPEVFLPNANRNIDLPHAMNISQESLVIIDDDENVVPEQEENSTERVEYNINRDSNPTPNERVEKRMNLVDITNISDLEDLSVKQLKELLIANRVDFKGCCEKNELLERVKRLWKEYAQNREKLDELPMDDLCKICMDAPVECVMLECGHLATCTDCGKQLSECPICRQYVVRVVRTFRA